MNNFRLFLTRKPKNFNLLVGITSVLILNFFLCFSFSLSNWFRISADLLILIPFLIASAYITNARKFFLYFFISGIFILAIFRFLTKLLSELFNLPFSYSELFLIKELRYLLEKSLSSFEIVLLISLVFLILLSLFYFIKLLTQYASQAFSISIKKTASGILLGFVLISFTQLAIITVKKEATPFHLTRGPLAVDITIFIRDSINFWVNKDQIIKNLKSENDLLLDKRYNLSALNRSNLIIIFIESYGAVLVEDPNLSTAYENLLSQVQLKLEKQSFSMITGFSAAPQNSGLSHLSFSTGTKIYDQASAKIAVGQDLTTLNQRFDHLGYLALSVMPGVDQGHSEMESFFAFKEKIRFSDFSYPKDSVGWANIPDQYALEWVGRKVNLKEISPYIAEIVLSSSHTPYGIVPTYIDNGEFELKDYHSIIPSKNESLGLLSHLDSTPEKYIISIKYSMSSAFNFIEKYLSPEDLIIVIGDHQPRVIRTKTNLVPVHIISGKKNLLIPFKKLGFHGEFSSLKAKQHISHEDFAEFLLESYSSF